MTDNRTSNEMTLTILAVTPFGGPPDTMFAAPAVCCNSSPAAASTTTTIITPRNTVGPLADGSATAPELMASAPILARPVPWRLPRPSYPSPSHYYSYSHSAVSAPTWGTNLVISKYFIQLADFQHPP